MSGRPRTVARLISRYVRMSRFTPTPTYGWIFAQKVSELSDDEVCLDETETLLIALKKSKVISGRKMVSLLAQHRRELETIKKTDKQFL